MEKSIIMLSDDNSIESCLIKSSLEEEGYVFITTTSEQSVLDLLIQRKPNIVILDMVSMGADSLDMCYKIREKDHNIIIIILSENALDMDIIMGLELGADCFMVKPFNNQVLLARLRAHLKRSCTINTIQHPGFYISTKKHKIYKNGEALNLSPKEYRILTLFLNTPNQIISRKEILDKIWGKKYSGVQKTVDVHICRLRTKIEDDAAGFSFIETVWGDGYRWLGNIVSI